VVDNIHAVHAVAIKYTKTLIGKQLLDYHMDWNPDIKLTGHTHTQSFYCSSGICPGLPG